MTLAVVTRKEERITTASVVHEAFVYIDAGRHRPHLIEAAGKSGVAAATIVCLALINIGTHRTGADLIGAGKKSGIAAAAVIGLAFIDVYAGLTIASIACLAAAQRAADGILAVGIHIAAAIVF